MTKIRRQKKVLFVTFFGPPQKVKKCHPPLFLDENGKPPAPINFVGRALSRQFLVRRPKIEFHNPKSMSRRLIRCPSSMWGGGMVLYNDVHVGVYGVQRCPCPWVGGIHVRRTWNRGARPRSPKDFLDLECPEAEKENAQGTQARKKKEERKKSLSQT